jgi:hypothetical protein
MMSAKVATYDEEKKFAEAFETEAHGKVVSTPEPLCFDIEVYQSKG